ncbi:MULTISPECIES: hypothetical protein [Helicobacter]|uniref:hypothetical protein n=1 Tax=Helicobacter TaxID=209 RepID=UPI000CF15933|nr:MULTISPECIES: hypothetical protein [Helicobacter]
MLYVQIRGKIYCVSDQSLKGIWNFKAYENRQEVDYIKGHGRNLQKGEVFSMQAPLEALKDYRLVISGETSSINAVSKDILEKNKENKRNESKVLFVRVKEENNLKLYFQTIKQGSIIKKNSISFFNTNGMAHIDDKPIILIQNRTDVYWNQATGKLYFRQIEDVERVLPYFFEDKVREIKQGLKDIRDSNYSYLRLNLDPNEITSAMPKAKLVRIEFLLQKGHLEIFKDDRNLSKRDDYFVYAKQYKSPILKGGKLIICEVSDLDELHHIIFEAYYTTRIGGQEQRVVAAFNAKKR